VNGNEVLIDLLADNGRRLHRAFDRISDDCLYWSPRPDANSIAVTTWHMGRLFDVFLTRQAQGKPGEDERWIAGGWAEATGYDPRGLGRDGWGTVNDYTPEEVAAMPRFARAQLLGYLDDVYETVTGYLEATPMSELQTPGAGFDGRYTKYQFVQMVLLDNVRHLGEIYTIEAMWKREQTAATT
jgi:hypothetical protein